MPGLATTPVVALLTIAACACEKDNTTLNAKHAVKISFFIIVLLKVGLVCLGK